ncbi:GSCOCT00013839001.3-RA-CDS, partial [Cotesia congregata]
MDILPECFFIFTCIGLWKPASWTGGKSTAYNFYTLLMTLIPSLFVISGFFDLILLTSDISEIIDNVFLVLTIMAGCGKMISVVANRDKISKIFNSLQTKPLKPQDDEEIIINDQYYKITRFITFCYSTMTGVGVTLFVLGKMLENGPKKMLPYRGWFPYNYSHPLLYSLSAGQQALTMIIAGAVNAAYDTFFPGVMFLVCAQVNIFKHRFKVMLDSLEMENYYEKINKNHEVDHRKVNCVFSECVRHHISIFELFDDISKVFSTVIFVQYSVGSVIFCTSIYRMSDMDVMTIEFVSNIFYIGSMLSQIFLLCVSANQVTLEFQDLNTALYDSKWFAVDNNARKSLIIMMINSQNQVTFTTGHIVTLSLDSFTNLVKLSYTIYNVLQQS